MSEKQNKYTSIGGQALVEGVMMQGKKGSAMAVRKADGTIYTECWQEEKRDARLFRLPFLRGVFGYFFQMKSGYRTLLKSMEISGALEQEEQSKLELWLEQKFGKRAVDIFMWVAGALSMVLSLFLFMFLPALLVGFLGRWVHLGIFHSFLESMVKVAILLIYLGLTARLADMKRMYQYHGAEHKTIFCYEAGQALTVENVRKQSRFHPMCGTSFLLIILLVGIFVFSFVSWGNPFVRTLIKVALLPVTVGISYEIIRYTKEKQNLLTKILSVPGLWLQKLTTNEPDDSQIEIAIAALELVLSGAKPRGDTPQKQVQLSLEQEREIAQMLARVEQGKADFLDTQVKIDEHLVEAGK